jgi:FAD/FMN-containing dehydrogenase/Fe-S oxidoreductase
MAAQPESTTGAAQYEQLAVQLRQQTTAEVRFDAGSRALYATDASNYRQVPIGVVLPRTIDDIVATVAVCREHGAPVLPRGGGTSLAGQCCNVAVVIDTSKYLNRILELDPTSRTAIVEPGCVLDDLRNAAEEHHLTFGPDPSTHNHNTLGGMIGNNSCGVHSIMAGRTSDNVEALEILTYDGYCTWVGRTSAEDLEAVIRAGGRGAEIYAGLKQLREQYADRIRDGYPDIPRRVSGYNLPSLLPEHEMNVARALVGSEGTCVFVLRAKVRLVPSPKCRVLVVLGFKDVFDAADYAPRVLEFGAIGLEGMDDELVSYMEKKQMAIEDRKLLPEGHGWLLAEFGADDVAAAQAQAQRLIDAARTECDTAVSKMFSHEAEAQKLWKIRESGLGATSFVPGEPITHPGWEDAGLPPERLGEYLRCFRKLLDEFHYRGSLYGHFGGGCVHVRISCDLGTTQGVKQWRKFVDRAADLVVTFGGSLSGEHGDGQARGELLEKMYGAELMQAMCAFKALWDPRGLMNPGKVVDPYPLDSRLREGPDFTPPKLQTIFAYREDGGDLVHASRRCVGVGECRREWGAVMCPSYQVTREEQHSTRGRARLLFETLRGMSNADTPLRDGWRSEPLHEALDLCLACKGCKSDCPVNVDMAMYKAEFMHHYYRGRVRPRMAYSMGLIYWWARMGQYFAPLINIITRAPAISRAFKAAAGIAAERAVPKFDAHPFTRTYRSAVTPEQASLCLWPDTFTNFFYPQALHAAAGVFEHLQLKVMLPAKSACCARPLYAEGMLDLARKQLAQLMDVLTPAIERGLPVVGLEPSCVATFRDELVELFPKDERALYLQDHTFTFAEFLRQQDFRPPRLGREALVHMHCNHRAVMGTDAEFALLEQLFEHCRVPEPGCCGMAGPFGFDAHKYDVSMKIAARVLLPSVGAAAGDTWLIADGFSCREQIAQGTGRRPVHSAEAVWAAILGATSRKRETPCLHVKRVDSAG